MHLLRRSHVYLYCIAENRLVTHAQLHQLRNFKFVPDSILPLSIGLFDKILMFSQEVLQHPRCLDRIRPNIPLTLLQLLSHRIECAVGIPATHPLQNIHGCQLVVVKEFIYFSSGVASGGGLDFVL